MMRWQRIFPPLACSAELQTGLSWIALPPAVKPLSCWFASMEQKKLQRPHMRQARSLIPSRMSANLLRPMSPGCTTMESPMVLQRPPLLPSVPAALRTTQPSCFALWDIRTARISSMQTLWSSHRKRASMSRSCSRASSCETIWLPSPIRVWPLILPTARPICWIS